MKKLFVLLGIFCFSFSLVGCNKEHQHTLIQHEAKEPTCTEDGYNPYEECTECDYTTYVKIEALGHIDEDLDHDCDRNCSQVLGEHVDLNNDHNCDYGCEEAFGSHEDLNNDHNCDYGCEEALSECEDEDFNCICDICSKELSFTFDEETGTYYVRTVDGLYEWANNYTDFNLELCADITLTSELIIDLDGDEVNDSNWDPIDVKGGITINGNNFTITGININSTIYEVGFTRVVYENGCIKNLHLENVSLNGQKSGGITANNYGTIINCSVRGKIESESVNQGGIVGLNKGLIMSCVNYANIYSTNGVLGGIVGQMNGGKVIGCYNLGNVNGPRSLGGIVGNFYSGDIISSYNFSKITGDSNDYGYIAGYGNGSFESNYWMDFEDDSATQANGFITEQEGCTLINDTVTWENAMEDMNASISTYNETVTTKCEYLFKVNTNEETKVNEPLVLEFQELNN